MGTRTIWSVVKGMPYQRSGWMTKQDIAKIKSN